LNGCPYTRTLGTSIISLDESGLLYVFDDHVMLAFKIISIFNDDTLALKLSKYGREAAMIRHNRDVIRSRIINVYSTIINEA